MTAWQSKECWSQGSKTAGDSWPVGVGVSSSTADQGAISGGSTLIAGGRGCRRASKQIRDGLVSEIGVFAV